MSDAVALTLVVAAGIAEVVIGLAWAFALVIVIALVGVFVQLRHLAAAQKVMDERVADLERAIGTEGGM